MSFRRRSIGVWGVLENLESRDLLTLVGVPITPTASTLFDGQLAYFANLDLNFVPGAVQINWGDKTPLDTTTGTIVPPLQIVEGVLDAVDGSHTYANPGVYTVMVTVQNANNSSQSESTALTATVTPGVLTISSNAVTGTAGNAISSMNNGNPVVLANFLDPNLNDLATGYTALVNWGDGKSSAGKVAGGKGVFSVSADHTYVSAGSYTVTVTVVGFGQNVSTSGPATIMTNPNPGTNTGVVPYKLVGLPVVQLASQIPTEITLASFTDSNVGDTPQSFAVLINWGDGDTGAGTVLAQGGAFTISGLYAYQTPGTYTASVTLTNATTAQTASTTATVNVVNTTNSPFINPYAFTIALAPVPANGPNAANGLAITNRPTFNGTAPPFALVQLTANRIDVNATLNLGEAVANGSGQWTLGVDPLADGIYDIAATVTPPGGAAQQATNPAGSTNPLDQFVIDTAPPRVVAVSLLGQPGTVLVSLTSGLSGFNLASVLDPANYTFTGRNATKFHPASVQVVKGTSTADHVSVILKMGNKARTHHLAQSLSLNTADITDGAGNPLQSQGNNEVFSLTRTSSQSVKLRSHPHGATHR